MRLPFWLAEDGDHFFYRGNEYVKVASFTTKDSRSINAIMVSETDKRRETDFYHLAIVDVVKQARLEDLEVGARFKLDGEVYTRVPCFTGPCGENGNEILFNSITQNRDGGVIECRWVPTGHTVDVL